MSDRKYIRWDAPGVEVIPADEPDKIRAVSDKFQRFQQMNFDEHHHCLRGTHLKTHGCIMGKLSIKDGLPPHLAQGMFSQPRSYDTILRYSTLTPKLVPDNVAQPRGIGIKVFGVEGPKIWGEDKKTQDFTMNNCPVLDLRNPQTTDEIAESLERNWNALDKFVGELKARPDAELATRGGSLPKQYIVAMPQYSQSAYRYGDNVAKFGVFPLGEAQIKLANDFIADDAPINILSQQARDFHAKNRVTYSFCVQLLENLDDQPVDDIGIEWDETKYPWQQVATLEFEPQDSWQPQFRAWWNDRITVNTWHGLKVHKPLGSTNRMRRVVYAESRKLRLSINGFKDYIEPSSLDEVPAAVPTPVLNLPKY